jgi:hypothetical protein
MSNWTYRPLEKMAALDKQAELALLQHVKQANGAFRDILKLADAPMTSPTMNVPRGKNRGFSSRQQGNTVAPSGTSLFNRGGFSPPAKAPAAPAADPGLSGGGNSGLMPSGVAAPAPAAPAADPGRSGGGNSGLMPSGVAAPAPAAPASSPAPAAAPAAQGNFGQDLAGKVNYSIQQVIGAVQQWSQLSQQRAAVKKTLSNTFTNFQRVIGSLRSTSMKDPTAKAIVNAYGQLTQTVNITKDSPERVIQGLNGFMQSISHLTGGATANEGLAQNSTGAAPAARAGDKHFTPPAQKPGIGQRLRGAWNASKSYLGGQQPSGAHGPDEEASDSSAKPEVESPEKESSEGKSPSPYAGGDSKPAKSPTSEYEHSEDEDSHSFEKKPKRDFVEEEEDEEPGEFNEYRDEDDSKKKAKEGVEASSKWAWKLAAEQNPSSSNWAWKLS